VSDDSAPACATSEPLHVSEIAAASTTVKPRTRPLVPIPRRRYSLTFAKTIGVDPGQTTSGTPAPTYNRNMARHDLADRQFDALLERLDRIAEQLQRIDRRMETQEGFVHLSRELRTLNESLSTLAYAALGQQPQVRRRRTG
jgi:hypothetical protein